MFAYSRNLYKIRDSGIEVVAFITAASAEQAMETYKANGGKALSLFAEQISRGYPCAKLTIYR